MRVAPPTPDEAERLAALYEHALLDTPPDPALDTLTQAASDLLDVPIALISLVDADRQWFKSRVGLDTPETPREHAFCAHAIQTPDLFVVEDAWADIRFFDNPLVTGDPHVRFYAGAPVRSREGHALGTLCVIDRRPRRLTDRDAAVLRGLAAQAALTMELHRADVRLRAKAAALAEHVRHFEGATDLLSTLDADLKFVRLNPAWGALAPEDGQTLFDHLDTAAATRVRAALHARDEFEPIQFEETWYAPYVEPRALAWTLRREGARWFGTARDVTEERRARARESRLREQERLITAGTLAAGVGHEINNPLACVRNNLEFALEYPALPDVTAALRDALVGADRIGAIVRGLRALAAAPRTPVPIDLAPVLAQCVRLAAHETRLTATVSTHLGELPRALGDESRVTQILVNLLVNAAQAFPSRDPTKHRIDVTGSRTATSVSIHVRDNGPGIPEHLLGRIWDPFFTTKEPGQGTGLGLSISRTIATQLGGHLDAETGPDGSTFTLTLPIDPHERRVGLVLHGDEIAARSLLRLLRDAGQWVASAPSEGAAHLESRWFDLVICAPEPANLALHRDVLHRNPDQARRFLFLDDPGLDPATAERLAALPNARLDLTDPAVAARAVREALHR